jgi:hypothetical protein
MQRPGDRAADAGVLTDALDQPGPWPDPMASLDERGGGTALTVAISLLIFFLAVTFAVVLNTYPSAVPWMR